MKNHQLATVEEPTETGKEPSQSPMRLFLVIFAAPIGLILVLMAVMNLLD